MGSAEDGTPAGKKRGRPGIEELAPRFEECMNIAGFVRGSPKTLTAESFRRLSTLFSSQFEPVFKCKPTKKAIAARGAGWVFEDITLQMDSGTEDPLEAFLIISSPERASTFEAHMLRAGVTKNVAMTLGEGNGFRRFATNFKSAFVTAFGVEPTREWIRLTGAGWVFKQMTLRTCNGTAGSTTDPLEAFLKISGELRARNLGAPRRSTLPPASRPSRVPAGRGAGTVQKRVAELPAARELVNVSTKNTLRTFIFDRLRDINRSADALWLPLTKNLKIPIFPRGDDILVEKKNLPALILVRALHNVMNEGGNPVLGLSKHFSEIEKGIGQVKGGEDISPALGMQLWALVEIYSHRDASFHKRVGSPFSATVRDIVTSPIAESFFKRTEEHYLGSSG